MIKSRQSRHTFVKGKSKWSNGLNIIILMSLISYLIKIQFFPSPDISENTNKDDINELLILIINLIVIIFISIDLLLNIFKEGNFVTFLLNSYKKPQSLISILLSSKESLEILPQLGLNYTTKTIFNTKTNFYPISKINNILINEQINQFQIYFSLILILENNQIQVLFKVILIFTKKGFNSKFPKISLQNLIYQI